LLLASAVVGCGAPADTSRTAYRSEHHEAFPATDRDPLPYTPSPSAEGRTDETIALAATGGEDQARRLLPAFLRAIRDADERELTSILADAVGSVRSRRRTRQGQARASVIQRIMVYARRALLPPDVDVTDLVDLQRLVITRASEFWRNRDMPELVHPTDLVVDVPLLEGGRGPLRTLLNWSVRGHLVVRPGRDARIVAL
jgi:hypothetical protein